MTLPCGRGPIIAVAGQFVQTEIDTTVGALLDGDPIPARPCRPDPIALPSGQQELLISPGAAFVVDGVQLVGPAWPSIAKRRNEPRSDRRMELPITARWTSPRRRHRASSWSPRASTRVGPPAPPTAPS